MLSPSGFSKYKGESIIGNLGEGLLSPKFNNVLKRGVNNSPLQKKKSPEPSKAAKKVDFKEQSIDEEDAGKPKTITMNCGMIKFQDIVIPPSAPTDLICEECEVAISVLYCRRCKQVFCMRCAEQCHPKPYGEDYHPHEVDESVRAVQFGDTSRIKPDTSFKMPDIELHEDEYLKYKDLSKPQSLSTSLYTVQPTYKTYQAPKYDVLQIVLFKDPHTEKEAYGRVISQWDQRHGTMATPAIIRGDQSIVYYIVQLQGYTSDVHNIASLIPPVSSVQKIENFPVIEGVEIDAMMAHRKAAHIVNKKIAAAEGIKALGPKHHLRDIVNYGYQKDAVLLDNREYGLTTSSNNIKGDQLLNSAVYNSNLDDMSECVTVASSTVSQRLLIANKHRKLRLGTSNEYIVTPMEYRDDMYTNVDLNLYADIDTDVHSQLSLDNPLSHPYPAYHRSYQHVLHNGTSGNACDNTINSNESRHGDDQSSASGSTVSSVQNAHKHNTRGSAAAINVLSTMNKGRAVQKLLQKHARAMTNTSSVGYSLSMSNTQSHAQSMQSAGVIDVYTHNALQVLILGENEMCTVQERIASEVVRKNNLLRKVWNKLSGSEKVLMKQHGFSRWLHNVNLIRDNQQHRAAIIMQALARKFLCRDKLAEKTEEFINKQIKKRTDLHAQFRYSDATDPRAVTMDKKIYFKTHLDLNRYAALLRVLMYKLAKYLARKRFALLRHAISRWRSGLVTFLESDIQISHINEIAIEPEPSDPTKQFVSLEHQRNRITQQHLRLQAVAEGVVLTSPLLKFPTVYVDDLGHDTVVSLPLRLPAVPKLDDATHLSAKMAEFAQMKSAKLAAADAAAIDAAAAKEAARSAQKLMTNSAASTALATVPEGSTTTSQADNRCASRGNSRNRRRIGGAPLPMDLSAALSGTGPLAMELRPHSSQGHSGSRPHSRDHSRGHRPHSGSRPQSRTRSRPTSSGGHVHDRSGNSSDVESDRESNADDDAFDTDTEAELAQREAALALVDQEANTLDGALGGSLNNSVVDNDILSSLPHERVPSYFPSEGINLPLLPQIYIPHTAEGRLHLKNERRLDNCRFRDHMVGPTYDSNWIIPGVLCMGSMPWGAAEVSNTDYPVAPVMSHLSVSMKSMKGSKSMKIGAGDVQTMSPSAKFGITYDRTLSTSALNTSTNATDRELVAKNKFKTDRWRPPPVTSVSALLLNKVDYFVSLMDEDEEMAIETACAVPSVESCIQNALVNANAAVMTIISQCTEIIARQTKRLDDIPRYGKTDPRQHAAYREMLRCKARISLATDNMNKAKLQIKNLAPHADFMRIPLRIDGLITLNELLPKIWQIEELLQQGRTVYVYSRDGHGRAGLVAGTILGRLYNLHPYEALYRLQASHDSAKREAKRSIPINCPQLPVQRELLTQILRVTNLPTELTHVRTQLDPETFAEYLPQRPLLYDTGATGGSIVGSQLTSSHTHSQARSTDKKNKGSKLTAQSSVNSAYSVHSATSANSVDTGGNQKVLALTLDGGSAQSTARSSLLKSLSWRSYDSQTEYAALEAAEQAHNAELGNNMEIIEAENEFLEALFAAQNIRKKQNFGMKSSAPYTWGRNDGITHRGDVTVVGTTPVPTTVMPAEPQLPELYHSSMLGQSVDVARKLPTRRTEPTLRPHLPHIRTAAAPAPPHKQY